MVALGSTMAAVVALAVAFCVVCHRQSGFFRSFASTPELNFMHHGPGDWTRALSAANSGSESERLESAEQGLTTLEETATTFWQRVQCHSESTVGMMMRRGTLPEKRKMMMRLDGPILDLRTLVNSEPVVTSNVNPPQQGTLQVRVWGGGDPCV